MDELQMLKSMVEEDLEPDAATLAQARLAIESAAASERRAARPDRDRPRAIFSIRRRWLVLPVAVAIGTTALLVAELLPQGDTDLGMEISYANSLPGSSQPHFLDSAITPRYLPPGFSLDRNTIVNKLTQPVRFTQDFAFTKTTAEGVATLSILIDQAAKPSKVGAQIGTTTGASFPMTIGGRRGEFTVHPPVPPPPSSSSGSPVTAACGPPSPQQTTPTRGFPGSISFLWQERPSVVIEVAGNGISLDELRRTVAGLVVHPAAAECLSGNHITSTTGACQPGINSSPPVSNAMIPPGGHVVGTGTVDGEPWAMFASIEQGNMWFQFNFQGRLLSGSCGTETLAPDVSVSTTLADQRFAYGAVPAWVTSVTATSSSGFTVSQPVLPERLNGVAFFALYLGKAHGVCNALCHGRVTVAFYRGSRKAAAVVMPQDMDVAGFRMSGTTNPASGRRISPPRP